MNRPIKFRGRDIRGKILFGDLRRNNGVWCMFDGGFWYEVDEDSIAQLVGYDKDGREVYEGDTFVIPCGTEITAWFFDNITKNAKLKEAQS